MRSLVLHSLVLQHKVDLLCGNRSLQLLSIQHLILQSLDRLARGHESLRDLTVTSSVAGRDQISNATALEEGGQLGSRIKDIDELDHLHQSQSDHSGLCVVAQLQAVHEASSAGNNVLEEKFKSIKK